MRKGQPRRWAVYPYTDRELQIVYLRVKGIRPREIARRTGLSFTAVYNRLSRLYIKAGLKGARDLAEWAYRNGFDEPLPAEKPEDMPAKGKRRTKTRIRMRRVFR